MKGKLVSHDDYYKLFEHEIDVEVTQEMTRVKFVSNSNIDKAVIYFNALCLFAKSKVPLMI